MEAIFGTSIVALLIVAPLLWRNWMDGRESRALAVHARIHAALRKRFKGEPLVSIRVEAPLPWRPGRVLLSTPANWDWVVEAAWRSLMRVIPADYDVVVRPGTIRPILPATGQPLRHAA